MGEIAVLQTAFLFNITFCRLDRISDNDIDTLKIQLEVRLNLVILLTLETLKYNPNKHVYV